MACRCLLYDRVHRRFLIRDRSYERELHAASIEILIGSEGLEVRVPLEVVSEESGTERERDDLSSEHQLFSFG